MNRQPLSLRSLYIERIVIKHGDQQRQPTVFPHLRIATLSPAVFYFVISTSYFPSVVNPNAGFATPATASLDEAPHRERGDTDDRDQRQNRGCLQQRIQTGKYSENVQHRDHRLTDNSFYRKAVFCESSVTSRWRPSNKSGAG